MSVITFDRLTYIEALKAGGFDEKQSQAAAEALDRALRESVATRADIKELEHKLTALELRLTLRLGGMIVAAVAIFAALAKFL